jgi:hypothetical protein
MGSSLAKRQSGPQEHFDIDIYCGDISDGSFDQTAGFDHIH